MSRLAAALDVAMLWLRVAMLRLGVAMLWLGVAVGSARADAPLTLTWSAPAECPQLPAVQAELQRLLGAETQAGADTAVDVQLARAADARFVLTLIVRREGGEATRTLEGASCEALTQAGALVIALAIDPDAVAAHTADAPADAPQDAALITPPAQPTPPTEPAQAQPDRDQPSAASRRDPRTRGARARGAAQPAAADGAPRSHLRVAGRVFAHAVAEALAVPGVSAGFAAGAGVRVGVVDLTLEVLWAAPRGIEVAAPPNAGADFALTAGRLRGCVALTGGLVELAPCLGFELGVLRGESYGVSAPSSGGALWAAPMAGAELRVFVHDRVAVTARLDVAAPLQRPAFVIAGIGAITEPGVASVRGELGVSLYLR